MNVTVVGAGSWGTAFACVLRDNGHEVVLAARDPEQVAAIAETGRNPRYATQADLRGITAATIAEAPIAALGARRRRRSEPRLRRGRDGSAR